MSVWQSVSSKIGSDRLDTDRLARNDRFMAWLFVVPSLVLLALVAIYPFVRMIYDSVFEFGRAGDRVGFVGIENYVTVLVDGRFLSATGFTVAFVVISVVIQFLLGLGLALLIHDAFSERRQLLVVLSLPPMMVSPVVTGLIWRMLLDVEYGIVNYWFGLNVDWVATRPWAAVSVVVADVWMWTPLFVLVFTATLQSIPEVYYEAARVDGMNAWQRFKWVTFPQMRTAIVIVLLLRVVEAFKLFPTVEVLTLGGPGSYTETIAMMTYNYGFSFFDMGRASAAGVMYWLVMFLAAFIIFKGIAEELIRPQDEP